ncbi:Outer membrane lipoprotein Omp16 precursor [Methyloligella halotolerans]|uniref:Peptidoglycan-associated lipoprotein n=1 Tax=Methyloligella halotolerans TaxID=1177755 RepID=A0A1E2RZJ3_9HYPH|nr:peptidoglycan-associated lipoprotein Pal [Methyloligella halotolerans]ODA67572.1 Outer membrane lipoprotein Omp16 precursor [Methyloligella halotolerans]
MRFNEVARRTGHIACVLTIAVILAACARQSPKEYGSANGLGSAGAATPGSSQDFSQNVGDTVHFLTDATDLTPQAQNILRNQARWLNQYPQYSITLEGHADERGTREYNIALGSRRATTVRNFLAQQGVNPARMRTISYGKERPVAVCDNISCWSQNRRVKTNLNTRAMAQR